MDNHNFPDWKAEENEFYRLRLFVAGTSPVSVRAINNLKSILEQYLQGKYELEIVDIHQQPQLVGTENITAVPMLIRNNPTPKRLLVGDMSDIQRVLRGLNL